MEQTLKDLISRLPIPGLKESRDRQIIAETLEKELSVPIKPKQILFKDGVITVSVPPVVKSALQIRQEEISNLLQKEGVIVSRIR